MKKIISLLASVAMLASMFTSVSAAELANNANAAIDVSLIEELDAAAYLEWMGEELPAGQQAYLVDVTVTDVDLSSKATSKSGTNKSKRDGIILMYAAIDLVVDDASKVANVAAVDGGNSNATIDAQLKDGAIKCSFYASSDKQGAPEVSDGATTAVPADSVLAVEFIVCTTAPIEATIEKEPNLKITEFAAGSSKDTMNFGPIDANHAAWTVNGEEGSTIAFGEADEPKEMEVTVADKRFDLDINDDTVADGYAWEVLVTNYDSTKTLSAKFTDAETGLPRAGKEKTEITGLAAAAETDGSIEFVALLQLSQARNVNFEIVVE